MFHAPCYVIFMPKQPSHSNRGSSSSFDGSQPSKKTNRFTNPLGLVGSSFAKTPMAKQLKKQKKKFSWQKIARIGLVSCLWLIIIFIGLVVYFSFHLPNPGEIAQFKPVGSTKILDRNGKLLYDIHDEVKRTTIASADIPQAEKDAIVAIEDKNFYNHHGIAVRSILRSIYVDVLHRSSTQGASTITQQLARNAITNVGTKKTFLRKIREVIVALNFERVYSKDQILTLYLNQVAFGNNNYGIETASESYYGTSLQDQNPTTKQNDDDKAKAFAHLALLSSLPQSPSRFNPYGIHTDLLKDRRNITLRKMQEQGMLSEEMTKKAQGVAIDDGIVKKHDSIQAPHFVFYIKDQLIDLLGGGDVGEQKLATGGYKITTTLDLDLQNAAEDIIAKDSTAIFKSTNASNAALVSIDATNGQILAMVGSVDFNNKTFGSVNVTTANRQPGSSFKPLSYATLFKKTWSPGSTIFDLESTYDQSRPGEIWPHNYSGGGRGPLRIRDALGQSLNISAIKSQALAGTPEVINTAKDLGITTLDQPDKYGLAMVLGAAEVKMTDMVGAYNVFANGGTLHPVQGILKVEDNNGQVIKEWKDDPKKVLDEAIAYEITSILSDNDARTPTFGAHSALILPDRVVAAKTGTTSNYRDAWTIGFTPQIATAVWVGNNDNREMTHSGAGAMAAAPIWHDYMVKAHQKLPKMEFTRPDAVKDCAVAKYSNKRPIDATPAENVVHDICASWQVPKDDDDAALAVKLYKPDETKLATDETPPALVVTRTFMNIHSERPSDPVWENPVKAWAEGAGIALGKIPTEKYDPAGANDTLSVSVKSPVDGATVSGKISLQGFAESKFGVSLMTFFVDDTQIAQPNAPWIVPLDTSTLSDGNHTLKVVARDLQDQETSASSTFTVENTSKSLLISGVNAVRSQDKTSVTIFWTTNVNADSTVNYGLTTAYDSTSSDAKLVKSHTAVINGLLPAATYHYKITAKSATLTAGTNDAIF